MKTLQGKKLRFGEEPNEDGAIATFEKEEEHYALTLAPEEEYNRCVNIIYSQEKKKLMVMMITGMPIMWI